MTDAEREARDQKLQELLGADYAGFVEFKAKEAAKKLKEKARALADAMVAKDGSGKYSAKWAELNGQLDAIWDKCMAEANKIVGIKTETK